jgi:hypothetical protein
VRERRVIVGVEQPAGLLAILERVDESHPFS